MDTIIELYDKEPLLNVLAPSVIKPARLIYIGPRTMTGKRIKSGLVRYFSLRSPQTYVYFYPVDVHNSAAIQRVLSEVLERFPDAAIDVTGGIGLTRFSVGHLCAMRDVPVFAYNWKENVFYSVHHCEEIKKIICEPHFTVEQVLAMAGGSFLRHGHVSDKEADSHLLQDIDRVFSLCFENAARWNRFVQYLQATTAGGNGALSIDAPKTVFNNSGKALFCDEELMQRLEQLGMILDFKTSGRHVTYRFRSHTVRQCLNDIGVWLELYIYKTAQKCGCFDDVQISVVVDWNGITDEKFNTINELDVVLTCGVSPVFISCKSGVPSTTALNEIKTLTELFGGVSAKGVLVTMCDLKKASPAAYQRAVDMGIHIIQSEDFESDSVAKRLLAIAKA